MKMQFYLNKCFYRVHIVALRMTLAVNVEKHEAKDILRYDTHA